MCFYYNPVTNQVECSVKQLASECGLITISARGTVSVSKARNAIISLDKEFGFIAYDVASSVKRGGHKTGNIWFRPELFEALKVKSKDLSIARNALLCRSKIVEGGLYD